MKNIPRMAREEVWMMTKLSEMDLPMKGTPMAYCKICKEWVPEMKKHNKKRHIDGGERNKTRSSG